MGLAVLIGLVAARGGRARADTIVLRGSGELQGKVLKDPKDPLHVRVLLMKGRRPLQFDANQILDVIPRPSPLDEYVTRSARPRAGAREEYDLSLWCAGQHLDDLAAVHCEAALGLDPNFEPAHKTLGHVLHEGKWLTADEVRVARGLVKYHGKWVSEEEKEKLEAKAQLGSTQAAWLRRIKLLRQAILNGTPDRRREAENEVMKIQDREALQPLVKVLANDETSLRILLAHALGKMEGKEASQALVKLILAEADGDVRGTILGELTRRERAPVVAQLVKALRSEDVRVVNRAAWTLAGLDAVSAVPQLAAALVTTVDRVVMPGEGESSGFSTTTATAVGPSPALIGMTSSHLAYLTPPAMAPGAVAYGAYSVPFFSPAQLLNNNPLGVPMSVGVGGGYSGRGPIPRIVTDSYQNTEVLAALTRLTGQDFGYDAGAWRRWIKASFNPHPRPARQVDQP
ncbi:HEAT repeat domain-containing protein [Aquisphaera insulae]|uniref:HEAT repeat domain-containing protein n=1 Tax=Aquisphaera insulae TaxID=2712864 RepID=UPI0013EB481F|nr:HEAT repeat domain-containing protein [Aquisphaera insulae]